MDRTALSLTSRLPLTCTRLGTCCHGKTVWLNAWELARLADARGLTASDFRDRHTDVGGIRLRFDGVRGHRGLAACSQYAEGGGCRAHTGRPLACRLYPLGRERQHGAVRYVHDGATFPCLDGCPAVVELPTLTVAAYLAEQDVDDGERAQDGYLELAQDLAEGAFVLVFEAGLSPTQQQAGLSAWEQTIAHHAATRAAALPSPWLRALTVPLLPLEPPAAFIAAHAELLQTLAQTEFAGLSALPLDADRGAACALSSVLILNAALHIAQAVGADAAALGAHWLTTARQLTMR